MKTATSFSSFREYLEGHEGFFPGGELYFQRGFPRKSEFEEKYVSLREREGRLLPDGVVKNLPAVPALHPLRREWRIREHSAERLVARLRKKKRVRRILEVGCGNGWLTNYLAWMLGTDCCGIDVNETELCQATRVFSGNKGLIFVYGDILSPAFDGCRADIIVLAGAIQYFPDLPVLFDRLIDLLEPSGEIHITDSPVYTGRQVPWAKRRSQEYFERKGHAGMGGHYHHPSWESFKRYDHEVLYDPSSATGRLKRLLAHASPFPWISIRASGG